MGGGKKKKKNGSALPWKKERLKFPHMGSSARAKKKKKERGKKKRRWDHYSSTSASSSVPGIRWGERRKKGRKGPAAGVHNSCPRPGGKEKRKKERALGAKSSYLGENKKKREGGEKFEARRFLSRPLRTGKGEKRGGERTGRRGNLLSHRSSACTIRREKWGEKDGRGEKVILLLS